MTRAPPAGTQARPYPWFYPKYRVTRLVYFEEFGDIGDAIAREKRIKGSAFCRSLDGVTLDFND